jgi:hypothetical protein
MKITINLDEEDLRIAKSIVANQTHFVINSHTIEDAVIAGILQQIQVSSFKDQQGERKSENKTGISRYLLALLTRNS